MSHIVDSTKLITSDVCRKGGGCWMGIPSCLQHATSALEDEVERSGYARTVTPESLLMWAYEHRNWRYEEDGVQILFLSANDGELVVSPEGEVEFSCILPWRLDSDGF